MRLTKKIFNFLNLGPQGGERVRDCNVESVNENVAKNDESDDDTVTRKVFSPHNLGTPGSPGVKGPSS